MAILLPCHDCQVQYIKRAKYKVAMWKRVSIADSEPDVPGPTNGHVWTSKGGTMETLWTKEKIVPL